MTAVFDDDFLASLDESVAPTASAVTLPAACYRDPGWFEFERQTIFESEWLCVGRADRVPEPGDYFTTTLLDEPLIVVRGKDGELRVLSAVCQHRAMTVVEGSGNRSTFTCPYHHWVYGNDGRLLGAPAMHRTEEFDKAGFGLPSLPVELWQGFVFTTFAPPDRRPRPLAETLAKLEPYVRNFELERAVTPTVQQYPGLPWNWKVMFENFNDGYHANKLHQGIHDFCPSENAEFTDWDDADGAVVRTNRFVHIDGGFNPMQKALLPLFPSISEEERWRVTFALVPPNLMIGLAPDQVFYFRLDPRTVGSIDLEIGYVVDPKALEHPLFDLLFAQSEMGVRVIVEQDIDATTRVQRGLRSRFAPRGRYSWQEEAQNQLNRWLVRRYREHWGARPATRVAIR
jgi:phenylpropionate dioxygenase-like ring-hydroxylating dioxygenase large terminal subunit